MSNITQKWYKISELKVLGYPKDLLYQIAHTPGQRIAVRMGGKGPWRFDITQLDTEIKRRSL